MVTIVSRTGVSLSASATLNGFPLRLPVAADIVATSKRHPGDFADSKAGRNRRIRRRYVASAKRAFLASA